ncbi:MAG: sugar ABC transporter permease [Anaerolineales bacterium]|jgi:glucose/mannose transport system permease protein|nr:sugar ABC transporter permease [Anaerolineales bacterium]
MKHKRRERWLGFLILLPSIILLGLFVYGFIAWTGIVSLSKWDGVTPDYTFAGLSWYKGLFTAAGGISHRRFVIDLWNTFFFTIFFLLICVVIGLLLAILLDQKVKGEGIFRTIYLFPMSLSFVVTGVVWQWIFAPGIASRPRGLNALFTQIGLENLTWKWYTSTDSIGPFHVALIPVIIAAAWQLVGYTMAMYLAGLRGVPEELREAARVDGATEVQIYRHVVLPLLSPITLSALIVLGHISLKIFDLVYTMTGKGTGFVTDVPGIFMFETTFRGNHYAQGAAISMVMLFMVALVIVPYLRYSLKREVEL